MEEVPAVDVVVDVVDGLPERAGMVEPLEETLCLLLAGLDDPYLRQSLALCLRKAVDVHLGAEDQPLEILAVH